MKQRHRLGSSFCPISGGTSQGILHGKACNLHAQHIVRCTGTYMHCDVSNECAGLKLPFLQKTGGPAHLPKREYVSSAAEILQSECYIQFIAPICSGAKRAAQHT